MVGRKCATAPTLRWGVGGLEGRLKGERRRAEAEAGAEAEAEAEWGEALGLSPMVTRRGGGIGSHWPWQQVEEPYTPIRSRS